MYGSRVHHKRSIRLPGYDYSRPGAYAVTVCTYLKRSVLGEIVEGEVILTTWGRWSRAPGNRSPAIIRLWPGRVGGDA